MMHRTQYIYILCVERISALVIHDIEPTALFYEEIGSKVERDSRDLGIIRMQWMHPGKLPRLQASFHGAVGGISTDYS